MYFDARDSYLTISEEQYAAHDNFGYDQYETCIPLRRAEGCMRELAGAMTDPATGGPGGFSVERQRGAGGSSLCDHAEKLPGLRRCCASSPIQRAW